MKSDFFFLFFAFTLSVGCSAIDDQVSVMRPMATIEAEEYDCLSVNATKALEYSDGKLGMYFISGEYLNIWSSSNTQCFYELEVTGKSSSFSFDGGGFNLLNGDTYYALYPSPFKNHKFSAAQLSFKGEVQTKNSSASELSAFDYLVSSAKCESDCIDFSCWRINALLGMQLTFPELSSLDTMTSVCLKSREQSFTLDGTVDIPVFYAAAEKKSIRGRLDALTSGTKSDKMELSLGDGISVSKDNTLRAFMSVFPFVAKDVPMQLRAVDKSGSTYISERFAFTDTIPSNVFRDTLNCQLTLAHAAVEDDYYTSVQDAFDEKTGAFEARLLEDVVLPSKLSVTSSQQAVLALAGRTLSAGSAVTDSWFDIASGGSLLIKGPGAVAGWDPTGMLSDGFEAIPSVVNQIQIFTVCAKKDLNGGTEPYLE